MPTMTVSHDCLLEDISFELESAIKARLTINNPAYHNAKKYGRWIGKKLKPTLSYYETVPKGIRFPRGFANQAYLLCRTIEQTAVEIIDKRRLLDTIEFRFNGVLRPYQQKAVDEATKKSFGVLEAGTGSGKTVMALKILATRKQPTLVIVHSKELVLQWQQRAQQFLSFETGVIGNGHFTLAPLTIAIVNTARKRIQELVPHFGHVIVDECHRVPAALFTEVVSQFDSHYLLGLSATAFRREDELTCLIYHFLGDSIHRVNQAELQASGAILKPVHIARKTDFTYHYTGDYSALVKALTGDKKRNKKIVDDIRQAVHAETSGVSLVVSDRIQHCALLARLLEEEGITCTVLTSKVSAQQRAAIVQQVQRGEIEVLIASFRLISEGFDCPRLNNLFLTTPIAFEGAVLQVCGRVMRPAVGKRPKIYDYVDEQIAPLARSARARKAVFAKL
ncbi:MAG: helicase [Desulfobulbus propionicus]|nr:MAG: helicase [Desulfobulbus propionicus]